MGLGDEAFVDVEAGGAGEEGGVGFVGVDLGVEGLGRGDVGGVGDDSVVREICGDGCEKVGFYERNAVLEMVFCGVFVGKGQRGGGEVDGGKFGLGEGVGQGDGDCSGAGSDVQDSWVVGPLEGVEDGFDQEFGFGAGDEDSGGDAEGEAVELLGAEDVLDGFEVEAPRYVALVQSLCVAVEFAVGVGDEGGAFDLEGVHEEHRGVGERGGAEVGMHGELVGGSGEGFAAGKHLGELCEGWEASWHL